MTDDQLFDAYTTILEEHGIQSDEAKEFLEQHADRTEFVEMARMSHILRFAGDADLIDDIDGEA